MPSFINVGPVVSEPYAFDNVDTAWMNGQTFDRVCKSSWERWLKTHHATSTHCGQQLRQEADI